MRKNLGVSAEEVQEALSLIPLTKEEIRELMKPTSMSEAGRDLVLKRGRKQGVKLLRLKGGRYVLDVRGPGDDFCSECGFVAPKSEFLKNNTCPNPHCPRPEFWDD